ncbi:MAG: GNAT family N-acetyltransferase [Myxococcota bacterium]|nr:GNAT family N-acetyltransferase [Myxococcota bacterium]
MTVMRDNEQPGISSLHAHLPNHRRCIVLSGTQVETARQAIVLIKDLDAQHILWVADSEDDAYPQAIAPHEVKRHLGRAYDAVVLSLHEHRRANLLGQCQGFIWGGGALILRCPPDMREPRQLRSSLTIWPGVPAHTGLRFWDHVLEQLKAFKWLPPPTSDGSLRPLRPPERAVSGTREQDRVVAHLVDILNRRQATYGVLVAARGRGKSAALGRAIAATDPSLRIAVTAGQETAVLEVLKFANEDGRAPEVTFLSIDIILNRPEDFDVLVIDEAAQLPVPTLQAMVERHPHIPIAFATTTTGYEGTGRGFVLRFLAWLKNRGIPVCELSLDTPIRWSRLDPLERCIHQCLMLDVGIPTDQPPERLDPDTLKYEHLDRDQLRHRPKRFKSFFALLIHAHYRTTPNDLHTLLDGSNIELHALCVGDTVIAATMIAKEGGLTAQMCDDIYWGRRRIRGHALPETLISHSGRRDAGNLLFIRSVRIAVHPGLRRRGLATKLIQHIHERYKPDAFGTLFGLTTELLAFRRSLGYRLVRIGASRGARTGEPAAVMLRPISRRAHRLVDELRRIFARDAELQLRLSFDVGPCPLDPTVRSSILSHLPPPARLSADETARTVAAFAFGPRTLEAAATALRAYVGQHQSTLAILTGQARTLIEARLLEGADWHEATCRAHYPSVPAAMRAMRREIRTLVRHATPQLEEPGAIAEDDSGSVKTL